MGAPFILAASKRRRSGGAAPPAPPSNTVLPTLTASPLSTNLIYTPGVWVGTPPINVVARLFVDGVDVDFAFPEMVILEDWRGKPAYVRETAIGPVPGPVIADTATLTVPASLTLDQQVQIILAGSNGYALDPQDLSTMWQDEAGTIPAALPGDPVGRIVGKWGVGATAIWSTATAANRPLLGGGSLTFDGVDDLLGGSQPTDTPRNAPAVFFCSRFTMGAVTSVRGIIGLAAIGQTSRFVVAITSGRLIQVAVRRPDGVAYSQNFPEPLVAADTDTVLSVLADVAGTSEISVTSNGVSATPFPIGTPGNFDDTASNRLRLGANVANTPARHLGKLGRMVICPFKPTDEEQAVLEAWVSDGPFDPAPPAALQWVRPFDFVSAPTFGDLVEHNGQVWRSTLLAPNLSEPGIFGWEAVT